MEEDEPPPPGLEEGKGGDDSCAEDEDKNRHKKVDINDDKEEEDEDSKKEEKSDDDPEDSVSYNDIHFLLCSCFKYSQNDSGRFSFVWYMYQFRVSFSCKITVNFESHTLSCGFL